MSDDSWIDNEQHFRDKAFVSAKAAQINREWLERYHRARNFFAADMAIAVGRVHKETGVMIDVAYLMEQFDEAHRDERLYCEENSK